MEARRIAIVGGGISGLALAWKLKRDGDDVVLFEASEATGGKIGTIYKEGFELDLGPVTCSETPALRELILGLGLENEIVTAAAASSVRYIYSRKKLHSVEPGIKILRSSLLPLSGRLAFLKFPLAGPKDEDESVAEFVRRKFGEHAYQKLFNPMLNGIYAGDPEKLSARWTLKSNGSPRRIISLKGGLRKLTDTIRCSSKDSVLTGSEVKSIAKTDHGARVCFLNGSEVFDKVYLTTPAFVTAGMIRDLDKDLGESLKRICYSNVTQMYCEVVEGENNFDGFGFLVPSEEHMSLLGAVCVSNLFPDKAPDGQKLFVLFSGGDRSYPFTPSVEGALNEFNKIINPALTKILHVQEWKSAIPQFYVGHEKIIERIRNFEKHNPEISIKGSYVSGVAIGECV